MNYNISKSLNFEKFKVEVYAAIGKTPSSYFFDHGSSSGSVGFETELSSQEEEADLQDIVSAHENTATAEQISRQKLRAAKRFAQGLTEEFTVENISLGITQAGKTRAVGDMMKEISFWMETGSLYEAMGSINALIAKIEDPSDSTEEIDPFITIQRLNWFKPQIQSFLSS